MVADLSRADETNRGAIRISGNCFDEHRVLDVLARADIEIVDPGHTFILADRNMRMPVGVNVGKIKRAVASRCRRTDRELPAARRR